ncbi:Molybdenum cofactor biosynthesis protein A [Chlamydia abortus]|nr:Molybdenum cofactor biosynthesis protein A [Chlamydia abortus]
MEQIPIGPKLVYIRILEACNAGCMMCRFSHSSDQYRVPIEDLKRLAYELSKLGTEEIRFTGGEPTLYQELPEAIRYIRSLDMQASVITNGAFLQEKIRELIDAGISGITCSLDSPRAEVHDNLRGTPGLLEKALAGLAIANQMRVERNYSLRLTVNTIISNRTFDHIDEFIPILESVGVDSWCFNPIKDARGLFLNLEQIKQFNAIARRIDERLQTSSVGLNALRPEIFGTEQADMERSSSGRALTHSCCVVPYYIAYIDAKNGVMTACNCLSHRRGKPLSVEGVWTRSFSDIWNDPDYAKNRQEFAKVAPKVCTGCDPANVKFNFNMSQLLSQEQYDTFEWDYVKH